MTDETNNPSPESTEPKVETITIDARKLEILQKVKGGGKGEDGIGKVLDGYKRELRRPESVFGRLAKNFQATEGAIKNIGRGGEANKALVGIKGINEQIGESYELQVDVSKDSPEDVKRQAVEGKLKEDFGKLEDRLTERFVGSSIEAKANLDAQEEEVRAILGKPDFSRSEVRKAVFYLQQERNKFLDAVTSAADKVGGSKLAREVEKSYMDQWKVKDRKDEKGREPFHKMGVEEMQKRTLDVAEKYKGELEAKGDKNKLAALKPTEGDQAVAFGKVAAIDREIELRQEDLVNAANESPDKVCQMASDIKGLRLARKAATGEVRIALAEQRVKDADARLAEMSKKTRVGKASVSEQLGVFRDQITARINRVKERVSSNVSPAVDRIKDLLDQTWEQAEATGRYANIFVPALKESIWDPGKDTLNKIRNYKEWGNRVLAGSLTNFEIQKIELTQKRLDLNYSVDMLYKDSLKRVVRDMEIMGEATFGNQENSKRAKQRLEAIRRKGSLLKKMYDEDFQKRLEANPKLREVFDKDLYERVKWPEDATTESEGKPKDVTEAEPKPASEPESSLKDDKEETRKAEGLRPMAYHEVTIITSGDKVTTLLSWVDAKNVVRFEEVNPDDPKKVPGNFEKSPEFGSLEDAKSFIKAQIELRKQKLGSKFTFEENLKYEYNNGNKKWELKKPGEKAEPAEPAAKEGDKKKDRKEKKRGEKGEGKDKVVTGPDISVLAEQLAAAEASFSLANNLLIEAQASSNPDKEKLKKLKEDRDLAGDAASILRKRLDSVQKPNTRK